MEKLANIFNNWIDKKIGNQIFIIDTICEETELNQKLWFDNFLKNDMGLFSGTDFIDYMLEQFSVYLTSEFVYNFSKYIEPDRYSVSGKPLYDIFISIYGNSKKDNTHFEFKIDDHNFEAFNNLLKKLTLIQKEELMKNKLFSYVINQTNTKIFSNNDIRLLKLNRLKNGLIEKECV